MYSLHVFFTYLPLLFAVARRFPTSAAYSNISTCTGGTIYFAAHPADTLLYQNPDLFHDLYVYKCVTTVIFTSGDRGIVGNMSRTLEHGLEAAYSWTNGLAIDNQTWSANTVQIGRNNVTVSRPQDVYNVQIIYLRLPGGGPVGSGYARNKGESLRKLYTGDIKAVTTTDGRATYTLKCLQDFLAAILIESGATDVRVLDYKTGIPDEEDEREDHADHVVSARLVVDVMKHMNSTAKLRGYAASFARRFDANLNETGLDFKRKVAAFLTYAEHDAHMCKTYDECMDKADNETKDRLIQDHDVLYVAEALGREYYVS